MLWFRQHVLRRLASGERGATIVEYAVIVSLFVAGMFGAVTLLRASLSTGSVAAENKVGAPRSQMAAPTNASFSALSCSAGQVISASGTCTSGITYCQTIGLGYDSTSNSCTPCTGGNVLSSAGTCQPGVTACPAMGKWYNSATGVCDPSYAGTCVGDQTYNSTTNRCIQPTCGSGTWLNASAGKCEAKAVCVGAQVWNSLNNQCVEPTCQPPNVLNPTTHTCVPGVTYCSALSPARWYNQVDATCDVIPTCTNPALPYDSGTNSCKATATNCAAQSPARYYNSSAGTCDVVPTCTNPALPYDSGTNTCKATVANCAAQVPPRYLSGTSCVLATAPTAPTGLTPTRGDKKVTLTWTAPTDTGGTPITDYVIQYATNVNGPWTTFNDGTSTATSATITGLTNGTTYYFQVAAVNAIGTGSYSTATSGIVPKAPFSGGPAASYTGGNMSSGSTYNLYTGPSPDIPSNVVFGAPTNCTYTGGSSSNGCSRYSFDPSTGQFTFNSGSNSWGSRNATITIPWTVPETSTMEAGSGTLTIRFT